VEEGSCETKKGGQRNPLLSEKKEGGCPPSLKTGRTVAKEKTVLYEKKRKTLDLVVPFAERKDASSRTKKKKRCRSRSRDSSGAGTKKRKVCGSSRKKERIMPSDASL